MRFMKSVTVVWIALIVVVSVRQADADNLAKPPAKIQWHQNVDSAWKRSRDQSRPLIVFVTHPGCSYCTKMKSQSFTDREVINKVHTSFVAASISSETSPALMNKLQVTIYPTTVVISPDAKVVTRIGGYVSAGELRTKLAAAVAKVASKPKKVR